LDFPYRSDFDNVNRSYDTRDVYWRWSVIQQQLLNKLYKEAIFRFTNQLLFSAKIESKLELIRGWLYYSRIA